MRQIRRRAGILLLYFGHSLPLTTKNERFLQRKVGAFEKGYLVFFPPLLLSSSRVTVDLDIANS